ncbi:hypothetical protein OG897_06605 [Streptomyces sp. NBC_00237]|uniref:hypothetical protein n=1 Tax=Streptomyces sp. NBC_00237 TaxID=2975687 RepID=UPI00225377C6|nr:hypothetical protein [Streptomyces sp. NBC_00237]MCX5201133.1 hypothetical protein [Streptomyces sp. NBC_00237]
MTSDAYLDVFLRHHHNSLRLIVWDQHPPHTDPDATSPTRRRSPPARNWTGA